MVAEYQRRGGSHNMPKKIFDYSALKGKITEVYGSLTKFASAMNLSIQTISKKINNLGTWDQEEMYLAGHLLGIQDNLKPYFFTEKVE